MGQTRRSFLAATAGLLSAATGSTDAGVSSTVGNSIRWSAFYGVTADEAVLASYDIVVLDSGFEGSIGLIAGGGTRVCGYLSLGEIRISDPLLPMLDRAALLS